MIIWSYPKLLNRNSLGFPSDGAQIDGAQIVGKLQLKESEEKKRNALEALKIEG